MKKFNDGRDWFFEKRFGLFVHWGLYAIPAWHEQHPYRKSVSRSEYEKYVDEFNPVGFDPNYWLDKMQEAGMEYICFTTKHVDGFCLWDTAHTKFNVMNTPYGKDILKELSEACENRGIPLCLYYSQADMNHPNYPSFGGSYERPNPESGDDPDRDKYISYMEAQVRELCSNYGKISGFWWDANVIGYDQPYLNSLIRGLQPDAVINSRGGDEGDFDNAERDWNENVEGVSSFERPMEACQSIGHESWGFKEDEDYYSIGYLTRHIDKAMAKGGNYLLNIGPDAFGKFPSRAEWILEKIGNWYNSVKDSFIHCEPAPGYSDDPEVLISKKDSTLYAHLLAPECERLSLPLIDKAPLRAVLINNGADLEFRVDKTPRRYKEESDCLRIRNLPLDELSNEILVVKIEFDELPEAKEKTLVEEEG